MFLLSKNNFVLLSIIVLLSSCMSTKKVTYFQDKESVDAALSKGLYDAKIMPKDVLQIQAFSMTPGSAEPFNLLKLTGSATTTNTNGQSTIYDYLVDNAGNTHQIQDPALPRREREHRGPCPHDQLQIRRAGRCQQARYVHHAERESVDPRGYRSGR